jgi:hypothetical protein
MKKLVILFGLLLSFNVFADAKDGVAILKDDATEKQMQAVRDGAKNRCEDIDDEDKREVCVVDYFAQHNLEEEPSCD